MSRSVRGWRREKCAGVKMLCPEGLVPFLWDTSAPLRSRLLHSFTKPKPGPPQSWTFYVVSMLQKRALVTIAHWNVINIVSSQFLEDLSFSEKKRAAVSLTSL